MLGNGEKGKLRTSQRKMNENCHYSVIITGHMHQYQQHQNTHTPHICVCIYVCVCIYTHTHIHNTYIYIYIYMQPVSLCFTMFENTLKMLIIKLLTSTKLLIENKMIR